MNRIYKKLKRWILRKEVFLLKTRLDWLEGMRIREMDHFTEDYYLARIDEYNIMKDILEID